MATLYDRPAQVQPTVIPDAFGELPSEEYTTKAMPKVAGPLGLTRTEFLLTQLSSKQLWQSSLLRFSLS